MWKRAAFHYTDRYADCRMDKTKLKISRQQNWPLLHPPHNAVNFTTDYSKYTIDLLLHQSWKAFKFDLFQICKAQWYNYHVWTISYSYEPSLTLCLSSDIYVIYMNLWSAATECTQYMSWWWFGSWWGWVNFMLEIPRLPFQYENPISRYSNLHYKNCTIVRPPYSYKGVSINR